MKSKRLAFACVALCIGIAPLHWAGSSTAVPATTAAAEFDVRKFGAVGDGKTPNTQAFHDAIHACAAAGGGRVVVPEGTFLTGPIELLSHVELHVNAGTIVLFSKRFEDYPLVPLSYEGLDTIGCQSPIWGDHVEDISITGPGTFDAQGDAWRPLKKSKVTPEHWNEMVASGGVVDEDGNTWYPSPAARNGEPGLKKLRTSKTAGVAADYAPYRELLRPCLMLLSNSSGVVLDGPTFKNSPNWNLHLLLSDHIAVRNVTIFNPEYAQNGDGIDLDSCRDVTLSHCDINAGDDGICLKSGRDEEGRKRGRPTEDVTIDHCTVGHAHGGFVIGSEMSGGVRNVTVTHCAFHGTDAGLRFKSTRGRGGIVENIRISDVTMTDIHGAAIMFDLFYFVKGGGAAATSQPVNEGTPIFRHIDISNIDCQGAKRAILMRGLPEMPLADVTLQNVRISADTGVSIQECKNITLSHVHVDCTAGPPSEIKDVTGLHEEDFVAESKKGPTTAKSGG